MLRHILKSTFLINIYISYTKNLIIFIFLWIIIKSLSSIIIFMYAAQYETSNGYYIDDI